jgi:hypothetical protein
VGCVVTNASKSSVVLGKFHPFLNVFEVLWIRYDLSRASIHKGTLRKKTDLKTDSFLLLFTDVLFGAFGRLPNFFTNRSFYNNTATHVGGGGMLTM